MGKPSPKRVASASGFLSAYKKWTLPHLMGDSRYRSWWVDRKGNLIEMKNDPSGLTEDTLFAANTVLWKGDADDGQGDIHFEYLTVNRDLRGHGVGSAVLKEIIKLADKAGASLSLEPDERGGLLSTSQLFAWYRRHNFETVIHPEWGEIEEMLIRQPR